MKSEENGHHEPFNVPNYKFFQKLETNAEFERYQQRLAKFGLKDPWLKNYAYLFDKKAFTTWQKMKCTVFSGFWVGLAYAAVAIVLTELHYSNQLKKKHQEGHDH
ncbi:hypothetical protein T07_12163 [Trichinella nelsoni]|uniref:Uncharacterized protein n=1 Tax=Trichinella nelsoni TaxID=6336 RepID=A0A0V0S5Q7_9BILA|nr:hypothetical protein T07_12163 [Trichinella nelsoni]